MRPEHALNFVLRGVWAGSGHGLAPRRAGATGVTAFSIDRLMGEVLAAQMMGKHSRYGRAGQPPRLHLLCPYTRQAVPCNGIYRSAWKLLPAPRAAAGKEGWRGAEPSSPLPGH